MAHQGKFLNLCRELVEGKHNRGSSAKGLIITNHADDEFETNAIIQRIEGIFN